MKPKAAQGFSEGVLGLLGPHLGLQGQEDFPLGREEGGGALRRQAEEEEELGEELGAEEAQAGDGGGGPAPEELGALRGEGVADAGRPAFLLHAGAADEAVAFQAVQGGIKLAWGHAPDAAQVRMEAGEEFVAVGRPLEEVAQDHRSHGEFPGHIPGWIISVWNKGARPTP